ncbi:hypothetical protein QAD02_011108 [Eretmocerus hayati]|uniref:Uncharacterized protein n=1 Tax=Eretmocerus hayati TaxID=131215 RepID=A0ACC2NW23_9HYME|nr:hypothetical protein QAD02_011108 [Eretmocerus hayati]
MADLTLFNAYTTPKYVKREISELSIKYPVIEVKNIQTKKYGFAVVFKCKDPQAKKKVDKNFDLFAPKDLKEKIQSNLEKNLKDLNDSNDPIYIMKVKEDERIRLYHAKDDIEESESEDCEKLGMTLVQNDNDENRMSSSTGREETEEVEIIFISDNSIYPIQDNTISSTEDPEEEEEEESIPPCPAGIPFNHLENLALYYWHDFGDYRELFEDFQQVCTTMQEENRSMLAEHAVHIQTHPSSDAEGGIRRKIAEHDVRPVPSHNDTPGNDLHDYVIDDYEYLVDGGNDISMVNGVVENKEPCIKGGVDRKKQYWSVSLSSGELLVQTSWINGTMFTINLRNEDTCFIFDHFNWVEVCEMYEKARIHIRNDEIQSKKTVVLAKSTLPETFPNPHGGRSAISEIPHVDEVDSGTNCPRTPQSALSSPSPDAAALLCSLGAILRTYGIPRRLRDQIRCSRPETIGEESAHQECPIATTTPLSSVAKVPETIIEVPSEEAE